jgi:hypothetical protein
MKVPTSKLKPNPSNPRILRDEKFLKLKASIESFPDMLNKRPIVAVTDTDGKYMVIGGNMRLRACQDLKLKEVPIILADEWTEEQRREFIIKDNVGFGEWDWDQLANEWDAGDLSEWGLDIHSASLPADLDDFFKPHDADNENGLGNKIILEYSEDDYAFVTAKLTAIGGTKEAAIYSLLKDVA